MEDVGSVGGFPKWEPNFVEAVKMSIYTSNSEIKPVYVLDCVASIMGIRQMDLEHLVTMFPKKGRAEVEKVYMSCLVQGKMYAGSAIQQAGFRGAIGFIETFYYQTKCARDKAFEELNRRD